MAESWMDVLSEPMRSSGVRLSAIGIDETVWPATSITSVVATLCDNGFAILGGDIFLRIGDSFRLTCDSWHCEIAPGESWSRYVQRSCGEAERYLLGLANSADRWFTVVATSKPSAAQLVVSHAR